MAYDPTQPEFFDVPAVDEELFRVTEICDGCRRCHRLCPSFDFMLERIDANDGDIAKVSPGDHRRIVDLCYLADPARPASIVVEHPLYRAEAAIPPAVRHELIADLR